jgi:hypothetical protein
MRRPIPPKIDRQQLILGLTLPVFFIMLILVVATFIAALSIFDMDFRVVSVPVVIWIVLAKPNAEDSIFNILQINFNYLFQQQQFDDESGDENE